MKKTKIEAFTLVELIVVIVILAILATIAFLSFSSQSASARDSTRLADMTNIAEWLLMFNVIAGKYPLPDSKIDVLASGSVIWYQWYAWSITLNMIKLSNWWKDPLDTSTFYTYSTNLTQSKFQILWFLEDWSNVALSMMPFGQEIPAFARMTELATERASADSPTYSWRYAITKWDQLWILLQSGSLVPVQALNTNIDVVTTTWSFVAQFTNKENATWTWDSLYIVKSTMRTWWEKFPWCDLYNVMIWNQTWAGCNSTLWDWSEWWYKEDWSTGTVASCYSYNWTSTLTNCIVWDISMASSSNEKTWSGASWVAWATDNVWWKFYTWSQATQVNNACPTWWHLPSDNEFEEMETNLNGWINCRNAADWWKCDWLWWSWSTLRTSNDNLAKALKFPIWGYRDTDGFTFRNRWKDANIWQSTSSGTTAYYRTMHWNYLGISRYIGEKTYAFSVRCLRN
ncbi:MAG: hypothetical protein ACD_3C00142G0004 [uncultured bacterium (gcode 4)]|uniref:Fibrobacter succinogenes major paralogous domain-containing protein n=1 Tax=uncultured bacterium (gcode 4) TaxID=1234023 RepID=K2FXY4_9BACT|nr:MAG: hypothetical protein ACD_3C00142G0004 [uncultured bacterium (gcode 4)]